MDPNTARQLLRIQRDAPLTADLVERAFAAEAWARHPSRYPDTSERLRAEQWAQTLELARATLLREAGPAAWPGAPVAPAALPGGSSTPWGVPAQAAPASAAPLAAAPGSAAPLAAAPAPRTRRLGAPAVVGIVAGAVAVVAVLVAAVTFAAIGAARLGGTMAEAQRASDDALVERYQSGETAYAFPAALEYYADGRYDALCAQTSAEWCWQAALFTESDCESLRVLIGYSDSADSWSGETTESIDVEHVVAYEAIPVVFGDDAFEYGWVQQVTCLDSST